MKYLRIWILQYYARILNEEACHKGDFRHILIIGGSLGYSGAVRLAGLATQHVSLSEATKVGVLILALAGNLLAKKWRARDDSI